MAMLNAALVQIFWKFKGKTIKCHRLAILCILESTEFLFYPILAGTCSQRQTRWKIFGLKLFLCKNQTQIQGHKGETLYRDHQFGKSNGQEKQLFSIRSCWSFLKAALPANALPIERNLSSLGKSVSFSSHGFLLIKSKSKHL